MSERSPFEAKASELATVARKLRDDTWNYFGDDEMHAALARVVERLERFDSTRFSAPESKRAEKDHAIAAEVWNRIGLDDAREVGRWLNGAVQEIHWHRSRMTPRELENLDAQMAGPLKGLERLRGDR